MKLYELDTELAAGRAELFERCEEIEEQLAEVNEILDEIERELLGRVARNMED